MKSPGFVKPEDTAVDDDDDDDDDDGDGVATSMKKKSSGRRRIVIEYIRNKSRRHITFSKRKAGIMKKAFELSVLTGIQMLLLIASETGHVYTFATAKLQPMITTEEAKNMIQRCLNAVDDQVPLPLQPKSGDENASVASATDQLGPSPGAAAPNGDAQHLHQQNQLFQLQLQQQQAHHLHMRQQQEMLLQQHNQQRLQQQSSLQAQQSQQIPQQIPSQNQQRNSQGQPSQQHSQSPQQQMLYANPLVHSPLPHQQQPVATVSNAVPPENVHQQQLLQQQQYLLQQDHRLQLQHYLVQHQQKHQMPGVPSNVAVVGGMPPSGPSVHQGVHAAHLSRPQATPPSI